ncbi:SusC/RagA family TonB-linked outer membrane protein [Chitinophaga arvensicola]|uniref:TonB-linked outer membrane protein, SusC/RagA family n=1 Tax=Chitinophaga arvensicola TaxID=29529 RepID=A0A1I0RQ37_9BACT|nr:SusC/RagA family TonB-linked outer membrane protein [Chitinophaga arvensicola]SEW43369.1 TonB-linked outer membrane protein, SusC/RagA family [Chitinophaga arvensicola]
MKKIIGGLCCLLLTGSLWAQTASRMIRLNKQRVSLQELIHTLQQKEKIAVMYDDKILGTPHDLQLPANSLSLEQLLSLIAEQTGLEVKWQNNNIYIKNKNTTAAGNVTVKGMVTGTGNDGALPGVSISVNGRMVAVTGENGLFDLQVPVGSKVFFRAIGLDPFTLPVAGNASNLKIKLQQNVTQLEGVVVTALGIKRDEKALGYAVSKVSNEQLTDAMSNNWTNALTGKVAGLNMLKANGGPAGSTKIILRGENSISGSSEALIVVDGVIINGSSGKQTGNGSGSYLDSDSPTDFGTSLNDINPDDIESVSVLKGPGAAALYGARGANGAIIVTTKSGKVKKGLGVTVNSNATFETINRWPDYQYEYGQGASGQDTWYSYGNTADGSSTRSTSSAWGPKFDGQLYYQYDPVTHTGGTERTPWVPYKNNRKDFFETAKTFTNSVTLEGGNDKTNIRLSYTNLNNNWIVPNTGYGRNTVALAVNHKVSDKLQISTKVNYTNKKSDNLPSSGYNNQTIMYFIRGMVPNGNLDWFRDPWLPGQEQLAQNRPFSSLLDNPYLQAYEMLNKVNRNGVIGNISATYNFTKDLSLMVRTSLDYSTESRSQQRPKNTQKFVDGMFRTQNIYSRELNSDFLLRYNRALGHKFNMTVSAGGSKMHNFYNKDEVRADKLRYPGVYNLANSKNNLIALPYRSEYAVNSFYGLAQFSYNNYLFLDVTARNDWSSTLASETSTNNTSFFYPSVNASAILSDMFKLPVEISLLKLRTSVSGVGSGGTTPYFTRFGYLQELFPGGLANPDYIANPELKPMKTISVEAGIDASFLRNRVGFGVTLYQNNTNNQIIQAPLDKATGFKGTIVNAGTVINKGIEIEANGTPIKKAKGLTWNITGTFAANRSRISSLPDDIETFVMSTGPAGRGSIEARPGGRMGDIYGLGYQRSPDGQIIYNSQGYPVLAETAKYLGNTNPDWKAGINNSFQYKQFRFSFLFDGQTGGKAYSLTHSVLAEEGKLKKTIPGRYNGIIGDGVQVNKDGTYRPNDVVAANIQTYYSEHFKRDNIEANLFATDFIKLREARLDYSLPPQFLRRIGFTKGTIGIYGRDLLVFTKWPSFDPEFGTLGDGDINAGFEIGQFPSTRSFGINLTASF